MKKYIVFLIAIYSTHEIFSQDRLADPKTIYANTITAEELKHHLTIIAGDAYEGRETGEKGQQMTSQYIANQFKQDGIPPIKDLHGYFQTVPLIKTGWDTVTLKDKYNSYIFLQDFYAYADRCESLVAESDKFIFLGYGIEDSLYNDYKNVDVKDKVIMIMQGEPRLKNGNYLFTGNDTATDWTFDSKKKLILAKSKGVKCVLFIVPGFETIINNSNFTGYLKSINMGLQSDMKEPETANALYISENMANKLCNASTKNKKNIKLNKTISKINSTTKPYYAVFTNSLHFNFSKINKEVPSENVLGYIEGGDLKDELVIISAHLDHLGIHNGKVYNGADDDGSGTVGLIEIAEAFSKAKSEGHGPRRSILILANTGEEKGLLGSSYYTDHPVYKLENTVCDLNIDMIGRVDDAHKSDSAYIYIIGSNFLSSELHTINEYNAAHYTNLQLDYTYNSTTDPNRFYYRSDHYNFAKNNIPVIFFFNGTHEDYHQPTDDVEKIQFKLLADRCKLVFYDAWTIANQDKRIIVDIK